MYDENCQEIDDADLDPRIQIELEKLNSATDKINSLEVELDEANTRFKMLLSESIKRLKSLSKQLGGCIERARPYYEALEISRKAQMECQKAAVQFQRANEIHQAAKETVALAEERFLSKQHEWQFDSAWQEMLNHATIKVMEAETQKADSGMEHQKRAMLFDRAERKVQNLESKLRRSINKSRPYFEEKELCQRRLASQKERVEFLQRQVAGVKNSYASSLKKLERISEEIHAKRGTPERGVREPGVGAENDAIAEMDLEKYNSRGRQAVPESGVDPRYAEIVCGGTPDLLDKGVIGRYFPDLGLKRQRISTSTQSDLDYELELDRCDLQSLGSMSATTSSAVSDEDCIEVDSEVEELKADSKGAVENRKTGSDRMDGLKRFSENWEKQMNETMTRLGAILSLKGDKDSDSCSENKQKY